MGTKSRSSPHHYNHHSTGHGGGKGNHHHNSISTGSSTAHGNSSTYQQSQSQHPVVAPINNASSPTLSRQLYTLFHVGVLINLTIYTFFLAYRIRTLAIEEYGMVLHDHDPYFKYRAAHYLYTQGWRRFLTWFDHQSWYPFGRPIGRTIYPGAQAMAVFFKRFVTPSYLSLKDVCCILPACMGSFSSVVTGALAYELCGCCSSGTQGSSSFPGDDDGMGSDASAPGDYNNYNNNTSTNLILSHFPSLRATYQRLSPHLSNFSHDPMAGNGVIGGTSVVMSESQKPQAQGAASSVGINALLHNNNSNSNNNKWSTEPLSPRFEIFLFSSFFMSIVPAHLLRTIGGSFDNESIGLPFMMLFFYLWLQAVRTGSWGCGVYAGICYGVLAATWEAHVFALNLVALHAGLVQVLHFWSPRSNQNYAHYYNSYYHYRGWYGRCVWWSEALYVAFSSTYAVGTALAVQVPVIGYSPFTSSNQAFPLVVFVIFQLVQGLRLLGRKRTVLLATLTVSCACLVGYIFIYHVLPDGYTRHVCQEVGHYVWKYAFVAWKEGETTDHPLYEYDSVTDGDVSQLSVYYYYLNGLFLLAPHALLYVVLTCWNDSTCFLVAYSVLLYIYSHIKTVRSLFDTILLMAPLACVLVGTVVGKIFCWTLEQFIPWKSTMADIMEDVDVDEEEEVSVTVAATVTATATTSSTTSSEAHMVGSTPVATATATVNNQNQSSSKKDTSMVTVVLAAADLSNDKKSSNTNNASSSTSIPVVVTPTVLATSTGHSNASSSSSSHSFHQNHGSDRGGGGRKHKKTKIVKAQVVSTQENYFTVTRVFRMIVALLTLLTLYQSVSNYYRYCWSMSMSISHPSIVQKGQTMDGTEVIVDDNREAYGWLRTHTPPDSRVLTWWDYGYHVSSMANRTVLADGYKWNPNHVALLGKIFMSNEEVGHEIARHLADYVLVSVDNLQKGYHMAKIGRTLFPDLCKDDDCNDYGILFDEQPKALLQTLLYKLHSHQVDSTVELDKKRFKEVFRSQYSKVRIYQILNVNESSKHWMANSKNRRCDPKRKWFCPGDYSPSLRSVISVNKGGDNRRFVGGGAAEYRQDAMNVERGGFPQFNFDNNQFGTSSDISSSYSPLAENNNLYFSDDGGIEWNQRRPPYVKDSSFHDVEKIGYILDYIPIFNNAISPSDIISVVSNDLGWQDSDVTTELWNIVVNNQVDRLREMIQTDPRVVFLRSGDGRGPMWWAYEHGRSEIVELLLQSGVGYTDADGYGKTPLDMIGGSRAAATSGSGDGGGTSKML